MTIYFKLFKLFDLKVKEESKRKKFELNYNTKYTENGRALGSMLETYLECAKALGSIPHATIQ